MTADIYLFKHTADVRRGEPINVGVAVVGAGRAAGAFLGETEPGEVDRRKVRHRVSDSVAYAEWVQFWRHHLDQGPEGLESLADPRMQRADFSLQHTGQIALDGSGLNLQDQAERLFAQLVLPPGSVPDDEATVGARAVSALANDVLTEAGVTAMHGFHRHLEVADRNHPKVRYKFPFARRNGHLTVAGAVATEAPERVDALLWKFSHLPDGVRKVCLYRRDDDGVADARLELLHEAADSLVDLSATDAARDAQAAFAS